MSDTKVTTVSLRFTGSPVVVRTIGDMTWSSGNDYTADVPLELAADLLTGRERDSWAIAGKPTAAVRKALAEHMGLAPAELIVDTGEEPEGVVKNG